VERFNLKQLNEEEVKEQYQVTVKNKFAALENLDDNGDINRAWETIKREQEFRPNRVSGFMNKNHIKPWFNEKNELSFSINMQQL
jgi:hypothetical protein